jgi:hypothetical protein
LPDATINAREIESAMRRARQLTPEAKALLIPAKLQPFAEWMLAHYGKRVDVNDQPVGFEGLPPVTCVAEFAELSASRYLTVVWFQCGFAPAIASDVESQIKALEWRVLSVECVA